MYDTHDIFRFLWHGEQDDSLPKLDMLFCVKETNQGKLDRYVNLVIVLLQLGPNIPKSSVAIQGVLSSHPA